MKNKKFAVVTILVFLLFGISLFGKEVTHIKNIKLKQPTGFFSVLKDILFGKKKMDFKPFAIAVSKNGELTITDIDNHAVIVADKFGVVRKIIRGIGKIPFGTPVGVWIDKKGSVYVVDSARKGVVRFNSSMSSAEIFIADNSKRFTSLCTAGNKVYLTETGKHTVECYSEQGKFLFSFGKRGINKGEFNYPTSITTDGKRLFVVDSLNFRVQIFDLKGNFLSMFGKQGDGGGTFSRPKGIAIINENIVAVSDVAFDNVQLFDFDGNFLAFLGKNGNCSQCFVMPSGIFSQNGLLYICDRWNKRVSVWRIGVGK